MARVQLRLYIETSEPHGKECDDSFSCQILNTIKEKFNWQLSNGIYEYGDSELDKDPNVQDNETITKYIARFEHGW